MARDAAGGVEGVEQDTAQRMTARAFSTMVEELGGH